MVSKKEQQYWTGRFYLAGGAFVLIAPQATHNKSLRHDKSVGVGLHCMSIDGGALL